VRDQISRFKSPLAAAFTMKHRHMPGIRHIPVSPARPRLCPNGAEFHSPGQRPGKTGLSTVSPEGARERFSPFRAGDLRTTNSRGVAPGSRIEPLRGKRSPRQRCKKIRCTPGDRGPDILRRLPRGLIFSN
jgi:hypothetical protein